MSEPAGDNVSDRKTTWGREAAQMLMLLAVILAARSSLADHYIVPSGSMEYTLMVGDRVVVDKRAYGLRLPFTRMELTKGDTVGRGEVVIFDSPRDGTRLIKRIVAVGGDEILILAGRIYINGKPLATDTGVDRFGPRDAHLNLSHGGGRNLHIEQIPDGMVLAVGDHRGNSLDGRIFGLVPEADIYGRALAVYYRRGENLVWKEL